MKYKEIKEDSKKILDLMRRASKEEKATVIIDNLACKTFLQYIEQLENKVKEYDNLTEKIKSKLNYTNNELEEKYSADKISIFSGNTYMEKFKLIGEQQVLQELLEEK